MVDLLDSIEYEVMKRCCDTMLEETDDREVGLESIRIIMMTTRKHWRLYLRILQGACSLDDIHHYFKRDKADEAVMCLIQAAASQLENKYPFSGAEADDLYAIIKLQYLNPKYDI